jgi:hypothetical protein
MLFVLSFTSTQLPTRKGTEGQATQWPKEKDKTTSNTMTNKKDRTRNTMTKRKGTEGQATQ